MTAISDVGPGSFDAYEGIRIVIPGLLSFGVIAATFRTVAPNEQSGLFENPVAGLVAALAFGLVLYFVDVPARAAAYSENQPTDYLQKEFTKISPGELLTAYLLLLNTRMPANTRNRALYMGSMYRIGVELILTLALASSVVFGATLFAYGPQRGAAEPNASRFAAGGLLLVFVVAVWGSSAYNPSKFKDRARSFGRGFVGQCIFFYAAGIILILLPLICTRLNRFPLLHSRAVAAVGLGAAVSYWVWRYIRGDKISEKRRVHRRALDSTFAGFLYMLPNLLILSIYEPPLKNVLANAAYLVGWACSAGLAIVLVVIRGHERKLHGVYRGQTRWLKENAGEVHELLATGRSISGVSRAPTQFEIRVVQVPSTPAPARSAIRIRQFLRWITRDQSP